MIKIVDCIFTEHDLRFVLVAAVICALSAVAAFSFDRSRERAPVNRRWLWAMLTGLVAGSGVWAVHFVAQLAYMPDMPVKFRIGGTALSLGVAVAALSAGFALSSLKNSKVFAVLGGVVVGLGVAAMHFTGIAATVTALKIAWDPAYVAASLAVGAVLGGAAVYTARRAKGRVQVIAPPILLVLTIVGMHFTAMTAMTPIPDLTAAPTPELIGRSGLAVPIAVIAGLILVAGIGANLFQFHARKVFVQNLQTVFHHLPAALAEFDAQGRLVLWNQTYADLIGLYGVELSSGLSRTEILDAAAAGGAFDLLEGAGTDRAADFLARQKQGEAMDWPLPDGRWAQVETRLIGDRSLTIVTDITDHRASAMLMAEARDRAEAASRSKSEFLTNMSHEIRTPLNGVLGMVQVMEADKLSVAQRARLKTIKQSGGALLAILNDVLDLSKIEAGKLEVTPVAFDMAALAETARAAQEGAAAGKDLILSCEVDAALEGAWRGDALRIRQILGNLLNNAVKFTETGTVHLTVEGAPHGVMFEVRDTGIGIDPDQIPRLFERFSQEDATTTRRFGGTGLGLSICRELAELMGGRVEAESVKGEGSCFRLVLPLERLASSHAGRTLAAEPRPEDDVPLRILAAEDNGTNQLVLRALLEPMGVELTLVGNGREAVEAFGAGTFDVVLMDVMMPEMNGIDAARAIRALEAERGAFRTPIVTLTANVMQHQLDEYLAAGMDAALAKPIELEKLYAVLNQVLGDDAEDLEAAA